ncbi:MAG: hypothetical protein MEQ84_04555 [Mesorhizobium sp.]|nr:hypothetical protein [Mesorhizobium sp.]
MSNAMLKAAAAVGLAAALAGCQAMGPPPMRGPASPPPMSQTMNIDGEWLSTDGVATSRFSGGRFETFANDTGNVISEGNYGRRGENVYEVNGQSLLRQSPISFNCLMITPTQLNCTAAAGNQFSLVRRQGTS